MFTVPLFRASPVNLFSCQFDGAADYLNWGNIANFDRNVPFSFVSWFKTAAAGGALVARRTGSPTFKGYEINNTSGQIGFNMSNNNGTGNRMVIRTTGATFADGDWHHLVVTYDGSSLASGVTIYIAGVSEALDAPLFDALVASSASSNNLNLASRNNGENLWNGKLDESAMWNIELTAAQVTEAYNGGNPVTLTKLSTAGSLVSWLKFTQADIDNFPTIGDHSGNSNDATAVNMVSGDIQGDVF